MAESISLLDFLLKLIGNDSESIQLRDWFAEDPDAALAHYGLTDLSAEDVHDALVLIEDNQTASFDREFSTGGNHIQLPPPPAPVHHGGDSHKAAVEYLNTYVTNNYIDDRDTIIDNSINQQIDTGGGDFHQSIDTDTVVASGDGAVAAGGDIEDSTIVTGDDNILGDGNQVVHGDGNTTAFGEGDATSTNIKGDVTVGDGSAFASGSQVAIDNSDNSVNDSGNDFSDNSVNDSGNDFSDNSVNDSGNLNVDASTNDSGNDFSDNSVNDSGNLNVDASTNDSFNAQIRAEIDDLTIG